MGAEEDAKPKAEEDAKLKAKEEEARLKAEEDTRLKAEAEAKAKAEEEAKIKAEEEETRLKNEAGKPSLGRTQLEQAADSLLSDCKSPEEVASKLSDLRTQFEASRPW